MVMNGNKEGGSYEANYRGEMSFIERDTVYEDGVDSHINLSSMVCQPGREQEPSYPLSVELFQSC